MSANDSAEGSPLGGESDYSGESELDDESTINDAEENGDAGDEEEELDALEAEQDMPIEELMAKYYGGGAPSEDAEPTPPCPEAAQPTEAQAPKEPESSSSGAVGNPHGYFAAYSDGEEGEDADYHPPEFWRKEIRLGDDYQAQIPSLRSSPSNGSSSGGEGPSSGASLLWRPAESSTVEAYLRAVYTLLLNRHPKEAPGSPISVPPPSAESRAACESQIAALEAQLGLGGDGSPVAKKLRLSGRALPPAPNGLLRDDEDALYLLFKSSGSASAALASEEVLEHSRRRGALGQSPDLRFDRLGELLAKGERPSPALWSDADCERFEEGLKAHGKNFPAIRKDKLPSRRVGELVEFYYAWKKSERHDLFTARTRILKRHYHLHPDATDYMEHLLEQVEGQAAPATGPPFSPPPTHHIVLGGAGFGHANAGKDGVVVPAVLPIIDSHTVQQLLPE